MHGNYFQSKARKTTSKMICVHRGSIKYYEPNVIVIVRFSCKNGIKNFTNKSRRWCCKYSSKSSLVNWYEGYEETVFLPFKKKKKKEIVGSVNLTTENVNHEDLKPTNFVQHTDLPWSSLLTLTPISNIELGFIYRIICYCNSSTICVLISFLIWFIIENAVILF